MHVLNGHDFFQDSLLSCVGTCINGGYFFILIAGPWPEKTSILKKGTESRIFHGNFLIPQEMLQNCNIESIIRPGYNFIRIFRLQET